jgi:hypothetical protein
MAATFLAVPMEGIKNTELIAASTPAYLALHVAIPQNYENF